MDITIPTLKDIHTEKLIAYLEDFKSPELDQDQKMYSGLRNLCGLSQELIEALSYSEVMDVHNALQTNIKEQPELVRSFQVEGVTYGLIPNIEKISVGEYGDLDTFITPAFAGEIKNKEAYDFLSTAYRPIIKGDIDGTYLIEPYDGTDRTEIMKRAPSTAYTTSVAFFLSTRNELYSGFQEFLEKEKEAITEQAAQQGYNFHKDGDGLKQLINLQTANFWIGTEQLKVILIQPSDSLPWRAN